MHLTPFQRARAAFRPFTALLARSVPLCPSIFAWGFSSGAVQSECVSPEGGGMGPHRTKPDASPSFSECLCDSVDSLLLTRTDSEGLGLLPSEGFQRKKEADNAPCNQHGNPSPVGRHGCAVVHHTSERVIERRQRER